MSENYRFYAARMADLKLYRLSTRPLRNQFVELIEFVKTCEQRWFDFGLGGPEASEKTQQR